MQDIEGKNQFMLDIGRKKINSYKTLEEKISIYARREKLKFSCLSLDTLYLYLGMHVWKHYAKYILLYSLTLPNPHYILMQTHNRVYKQNFVF